MEYKALPLKLISANLFVYGISHALVDAICAGVVFSILKYKMVGLDTFGILVILYNILAFGLQTIFGFITDYFKTPRTAALFGCIIVGTSAFTFLAFPVLAVVLAGIGNALFHIGGGSISLNLTPQKASAPGIFVAPGAMGLVIGTILGNNGQFIAWPFVLGLAVLCILMFVIRKPEMNYHWETPEGISLNYFEIILLLILLSIAIRSMLGMVIVFPWKANTSLLIILTLAVVLGKGLGGILADKYGWIRIAVGALVLSIPFLILGGNIPFLAIFGMFLFNITMPVTLVAISNILPGRPGFAFGLTCLALLIGTLPSFSNLKHFISSQTFLFVFIVVSVVALYLGLQKYFINYRKEKS